MTDLLSSAEVVDQTAATYRQLDYWTRVGYITPCGVTTSAGAEPITLAQERAILAALARSTDVGRVAAQFGVEPRMVRRIRDRPSKRRDVATPGSGRARRWSASEVAVIDRMARLTAIGIDPAMAERIARRPGRDIEVAPGVRVSVDNAAYDQAAYHRAVQDARAELGAVRAP